MIQLGTQAKLLNFPIRLKHALLLKFIIFDRIHPDFIIIEGVRVFSSDVHISINFEHDHVSDAGVFIFKGIATIGFLLGKL